MRYTIKQYQDRDRKKIKERITIINKIKKHFWIILLLLFAIMPFDKLFLTPGILAKGDATFPGDISQIKNGIRGASSIWDDSRYAGFPRITPPNDLVFLVSLLPFGFLFPDHIGVAWYIFWLWISGIAMYYMVYTLVGNRLSCSFISALFYMYTIYIGNTIIGGFKGHLMAYAITPLVIILYIQSLESYRFSNIIKSAFTLALLAMFSLPQLVLVLMLMFLYLIFLIVSPKSEIEKKLKIRKCLYTFAMITGIGLGLNAFWILPMLQNMLASDTPHFSVGYFASVENLKLYSIDKFYNTILNFPPGEFRQVFEVYSKTHLYYGAFSLLVAVSFGILLIRKDVNILFFAVVGILAILFANGPNPPFGSIYIWLFNNVPVWIIFNRPAFFLSILSISYAFLLGATISAIYDSLSRYFTNISLSIAKSGIFILLISLVLIVSMPMLNGNFHGKMKNFDFPEEHKEVYNWLKEQEGDFRVLLLPPYDAGQWKWFPEEADRINTHYPPFNNPFVDYPPKPTITLGWGINPNQFSPFVINAMYLNRSDKIGKLLGLLNIRYMVVSLDQLDISVWSPLYAPYQNTHKLFSELPNFGFEEVWHNGSIYVFENKFTLPRFYLTSNISLVVGDRRVLTSLVTQDSFDFEALSMVFSNQLTNEANRNLINEANLIIIQNNKINELTLNSLNDSIFIYPWKYAKDITYRYSDGWTTSTRVYNYDVWRKPFYLEAPFSDTDQWILTDGENSIVDVPFEIPIGGKYEIWIKHFSGMVTIDPSYIYSVPKLDVKVDNSFVKEIYQTNMKIGRFNWVKIDGVYLSPGTHTLTLIGKGGLNIVSKVAFVPVNSINSTLDLIYKNLERSNVNVLYIQEAEENIDDAVLATDKKASNGIYVIKPQDSPTSFDFSIIKEDSYMVSIHLAGSRNKTVDITIGPNQYHILFDSDDFNYYNLGPFNFSRGNIVIKIASNTSLKIDNLFIYSTKNNSITLEKFFSQYNETLPLEYSLDNLAEYKISIPSKINLSLLTFLDFYHNHWHVYHEDKPISAIPVYSYANGFLVLHENETPTTLIIRFEPYQTQKIGWLISFLILTVISMVYYNVQRKKI